MYNNLYMPRKFPAFSRLVLLLTVNALAVASNASTETPPTKPAIAPPNFIFILADDQAWNGLSVPMTKGDESSKSKEFHTPNIEALATSGMTFLGRMRRTPSANVLAHRFSWDEQQQR